MSELDLMHLSISLTLVGAAVGPVRYAEAGPADHGAAHQLAQLHPRLAGRVCRHADCTRVRGVRDRRSAGPRRICLHPLWRGHALAQGMRLGLHGRGGGLFLWEVKRLRKMHASVFWLRQCIVLDAVCVVRRFSGAKRNFWKLVIWYFVCAFMYAAQCMWRFPWLGDTLLFAIHSLVFVHVYITLCLTRCVSVAFPYSWFDCSDNVSLLWH